MNYVQQNLKQLIDKFTELADKNNTILMDKNIQMAMTDKTYTDLMNFVQSHYYLIGKNCYYRLIDIPSNSPGTSVCVLSATRVLGPRKLIKKFVDDFFKKNSISNVSSGYNGNNLPSFERNQLGDTDEEKNKVYVIIYTYEKKESLCSAITYLDLPEFKTLPNNIGLKNDMYSLDSSKSTTKIDKQDFKVSKIVPNARKPLTQEEATTFLETCKDPRFVIKYV